MAFGLSATAIAGLGSAALGAYSASKGSKQSGNLTTTQQQQLDPRIDAMLFGKDGQQGLLDTYRGYLNQPQSAGMQNYGNISSNYLNNYAAGDMTAMHDTVGKMMGGNSAALAGVPSYAVGNMVNAPKQNGLDLSGAYDTMIHGNAGANPYLNQALQSAVGLTNASYQQNQDSLTNNLMRTVLPSIRSDSVLAGQYGGSRQGIAEGNALSDYTKQLTNANLQLGLGNSANTTGQQANAFNAGQDRSLSAMQGLGAQQYGTALQNANTRNAAEFMNVGNQYDASKFNAGTVNGVNAQNNQAALQGTGMLSGVLGNAVQGATGMDNYGINRATQVNNLLAPYMTANQSSTTSQPLYENKGGNMLGGALLGGQLGKGLLGGGNGNTGIAGLLGGGSNPGGIADLFGGSFGGGFF